MRLDWNKYAGLAGLALLIVAALIYTGQGSAGLAVWLPLGLGVAALAMYVVENREEALGILASRQARQGANSVFLGLLALTCAAFLQAIISNHDFSWDLSQGKVHTLADETLKAVRGLDQDVLVYAFDQPGAQANEAQDLLERVRKENPSRFKYEIVDMNKKPLLAEQYAVRTEGTLVLVAGNRSETVSAAKEEELVNALLKVGSTVSRVIYVVGGHGEKFIADTQATGLSELKKGLESATYTVREISLSQSPKVPEDCSSLLIAGPRSDFVGPELSILDEYLGRGGRVVFALDPRTRIGALSAWLKKAGIVVGDDVVVDFNPVNQLFGGSPISPIIANFDREHPITKGLVETRSQIIVPLARSVSLEAKMPPEAHGTAIASTFNSAWAYKGTANAIPNKPTASDTKGPLSLAVAVETDPKLYIKNPGDAGSKPGRLVVLGSSGMLGNQAIAMFNNQDFLVNSVRWLCDDEKHIAIAPRNEATAPLALEHSTMGLIWWSVILLSLGTLGLGIAVLMRRRRAL
jgi:ABC-type uncharacterized transport system involved in gliding motility auxiliary subunit